MGKKLVLKWLDPKTLKENPLNYRLHPANQKRILQQSLDKAGWAGAALFNSRTGRLIDGHLRREEAMKRDQLLPVLVGDWSEEQERAILAVLDPITGLADIDAIMFQELAGKVALDFPDMSKDLDEIAAALNIPQDPVPKPGNTDPDDVPRKAPQRAAPGQIYQLGPHRVMCGDARAKDQVQLLTAGGRPGMVLVDPPYGIDIIQKKGKNKKIGRLRGDLGANFQGKMIKAGLYREIIGDDSPFNPQPILDMAIIPTILWGANNYSSRLPDNYHWLVWDKKADVGHDDNFFSDCELAWTNIPRKSVKVYRHLWSGLLRGGDRKAELKQRVHPSQKPVALYADVINDYAPVGAVVLDLYGGSGSVLIACEQTGRTCWMMEIEPYYVDIILKRWEDFTGQEAVLAP